MLYTQYTGFYGVYLIYGMDYGMDWWNGISANQNCHLDNRDVTLLSMPKLTIVAIVSAVSPLLASTGLLCLASVF